MTLGKQVATGLEILIKGLENVSMRWYKVLCRGWNLVKTHKQNSQSSKMVKEPRINFEEPLRGEQSWLMKTSATVE